MSGINRNLSEKIEILLDEFPAVVILGSRQVGKTTLAKQLRPDWHYVDLERHETLDAIIRDPSFFFSQYPDSLIIDEAQIYPELTQTLRGVIDENRMQKGRFILTGSSSPDLLSQTSDSLAGRIALVTLNTLKANEVHGLPLSPLYQIFETKINKKSFDLGVPPLTVQQIRDKWYTGGYPEPVLHYKADAYARWMRNFIDTYVKRDIGELFPRLNKNNYQRFFRIIGKLSGTILNQSDIARALEIRSPTVKEYLEIAEGTFLWKNLPSFESNVVKSVIKMPKGYLRDTGLLHYLLGIYDAEQLFFDPISGQSFESFVIEEILAGMEASKVENWQAYYYRTKSGSEVDLILKGPFGLLPIEIKQGTSVFGKQLTGLSKFLADYQLEIGLVINQSTEVKWLSKNILQLPVGWV